MTYRLKVSPNATGYYFEAQRQNLFGFWVSVDNSLYQSRERAMQAIDDDQAARAKVPTHWYEYPFESGR